MAVKCPKCHSENPDTPRFCRECGTHLAAPEVEDARERLAGLKSP